MTDTTPRDEHRTKHIQARFNDWRAVKMLATLHDLPIADELSRVLDAAYPHLPADDQAIIAQARAVPAYSA